MKRGQAWGFDLAVAGVIFVVAVVLFYLYTLNFSSGSDDVAANLNYEARILSDSLLSEGFPLDWNENNVAEIGILSVGKVNNTKVKNFYDLSQNDYQRTKNLFNVANDYYAYFDEVIEVDGTQINGIGLQESNPDNLVKISRIVIHDNKIKTLHVKVWN